MKRKGIAVLMAALIALTIVSSAGIAAAAPGPHGNTIQDGRKDVRFDGRKDDRDRINCHWIKIPFRFHHKLYFKWVRVCNARY